MIMPLFIEDCMDVDIVEINAIGVIKMIAVIKKTKNKQKK